MTGETRLVRLPDLRRGMHQTDNNKTYTVRRGTSSYALALMLVVGITRVADFIAPGIVITNILL